MSRDIRFSITALVDGEINDQQEAEKLRSIISADKELAVEYEVQSAIKKTVRSRCAFHPCPEDVKKRILNEIKRSGGQKKTTVLYPRFTISAAAAAVILIGFFILNSLTASENLIALQSGDNNMIVQAVTNFSSIKAGKLTPQIVTADAEKIQSFFAEKGVVYATAIPAVKGCSLLGGVVSEDRGEKLAHHVYADPEGKLIYVFQADEAHFLLKKTLALSDELWEKLESENAYFAERDNYSLAVFRSGRNISTIVSDQKLATLKEELSSYYTNGVN